MGFDQATHQPSERYYSLEDENDHLELEENDVKCSSFDQNMVAQGVKDPANEDPKTTCTDFNVKVKCESEKENGLRINKPTPLVVPDFSPEMESSPYVLQDATSPPTSPSARCKSACVPSFKSVTKVFAFPSFLWAKVDAFIDRLNNWSKSADSLAEHFLTHMKLGESMSETVWGKVSLGIKIVTEGGIENLFKLNFSVGPREKLVKTSSCYLSTSSGPIAGLLFISTEKIAFCSDRPLSFTSNRKIACSYYRVAIPLGRASSVNQYENLDKPAEKYIQIQTVDNHEFWLMGFVNYKKALKHLQRSIMSH